MHWEYLLNNYEEAVAMILFGIGFSNLLLQKNRGKIHDLMLLGYTPSQVARYYEAIVVSVNAGVLLLALAGMLMASAMWQGSIEALGAEGASCWPTVLTGVVIILVITAGNIMAIRRNVRSSFRN